MSDRAASSGTDMRFDFITPSAADRDADAVREVLLEHGESLEFDTCFGGFDQELAMLPGDHAPPCGCLLLAKEGGEAAGCVSVRPLNDTTREM